MRKVALLIINLLALAVTSHASYTISALNTPVTEAFNTLNSSTVNSFFSPTVGVQTLVTGTGFEGTRLSGTGSSSPALIADNGSTNSSGVMSYGSTGSGERALGLNTAGTHVMGIGARIINGTGTNIARLVIAFTQENWRLSNSVVNTMSFGYSTSSTPSAFITDPSFTSFASLDLVGPVPVGAPAALDGNVAANQVAKSATLTFATPVAPGGSIYVRWTDFNDSGIDAGMAIDNLSFTAQAVPEPGTMLALGLGGVALIRKRRS